VPPRRIREPYRANARGYLIVTGSAIWPSVFPGTKVHRECCPAVHLSPLVRGYLRLCAAANGDRVPRALRTVAASRPASTFEVGAAEEEPWRQAL